MSSSRCSSTTAELSLFGLGLGGFFFNLYMNSLESDNVSGWDFLIASSLWVGTVTLCYSAGKALDLAEDHERIVERLESRMRINERALDDVVTDVRDLKAQRNEAARPAPAQRFFAAPLPQVTAQDQAPDERIEVVIKSDAARPVWS